MPSVRVLGVLVRPLARPFRALPSGSVLVLSLDEALDEA